MSATQTVIMATAPYILAGFQLEELFLVIYPAEVGVGVHLCEHYPDAFNRGAWWSMRYHYRTRRPK